MADSPGSVDNEPEPWITAKPMHLQVLSKALDVNLLINQVLSYIDPQSLSENPVLPALSKPQTRQLKVRAYELNKVKKSKKWLKNIILDKSDSSDDDYKQPDLHIKEMLKLRKLSRVAKRELAAGEVEEPEQYRQFSTSLLCPPSKSDKGPAKGKKPATTRKPKKVKELSPVPEHPIKMSIKTVKQEPPEEKVFSSSSNLASIIDSVATNVDGTTSSATSVVESKLISIKTEPTPFSLDDIVYDPCLPDEILEPESPASAPIVDSVTSTRLIDDLATSENESSVSTPTTAISITPLPLASSSTAPPTPTQSSPASSPSRSIKRRPTKSKAERIRDERKRIWTTIISRDIPRQAELFALAKKEGIISCKQKVHWCKQERNEMRLIKQEHMKARVRAKKLVKEMLEYYSKERSQTCDIMIKQEPKTEESNSILFY